MPVETRASASAARRSRRPCIALLALFAAIMGWTGDGSDAASQPPSAATVPAAAIDRLFERWNTDRTPGFAVGVVRNGRLVFARGYGMANLEHRVPITPRSPFYIASMSKQFTAACAALLAQRGQLDLDGPVRTFIPELRAWGSARQPLTVRHLLHHIGGVREWSSLSLFAGQDDRFEHRIDNEDVLRMLARQEELEFAPGSRYRYSSGGYQLLTTVIERMTGKSLRRFAHDEIFGPLGMTGTFFEDDYTAIMPGRVESYRSPVSGRYERVLKHVNVYGDGGLITTVEDLARWDAAVQEDRVAAPGVARMLLTRGRLNNGTELGYAFGLEVYSYKGHPVVEHGGHMLGFTVDMVRFPDERLTVIALANSTEESSTAMAFRVADLFIRDRAVAEEPRPLTPAMALDAEVMRKYVGHYWSAERNFYRRVLIRSGQLHLDAGEGTPSSVLVPVGPHRFVIADQRAREVVFENMTPEAQVVRVGRPEIGYGFVATRYDPTPPTSSDQIRPFLGEYWSDELAASYRFREEGGRVVFQINDGKPIQVFPAASPNVLWNARNMLWTGFGELIFRRNDTGAVYGLTVGDSRVSRIFFRKVR